MQGSREGTQPMVSPNAGQLRTVGPLDAAADLSIADETPLFAAGPGIKQQARGLVFEQVNVAATLATLAPRHLQR